MVAHQRHGDNRESNAGPLAPKARIIPLDHYPFSAADFFCDFLNIYIHNNYTTTSSAVADGPSKAVVGLIIHKMPRLRLSSIVCCVLLAAGTRSDAAAVFPGSVSALGLASHRRHERSEEITALPGFDGRMPSRQYGGYITGALCFAMLSCIDDPLHPRLHISDLPPQHEQMCC